MSKKYNFGQLVGLIIGVTVGGLGVNWAYHRFFTRPTHSQALSVAASTGYPQTGRI